MKKFPVLLWALIMAFSLVACGSSDGPENSIDQDQTPDTYGTEQPEARTVVDVWNREVEDVYKRQIKDTSFSERGMLWKQNIKSGTLDLS